MIIPFHKVAPCHRTICTNTPPLRAPKDEERQKHLDALLLTPQLWFAAPSSFNDPMDCRPGVTFDAGTAQDQEKFRQTTIKRMLRRDWPTTTSKELAALHEEYDKKYSAVNEELFQIAHAFLSEDLQNDIGVLCLSECERDPVMFNHYADSHKGMCLQFRTDAFFAHAEPVQYGLDYPVIEFFDNKNNGKQFEKIFLTKYQGWQYEHEWRVIHPRQKPDARLTSYPIELLEGVIFGYRMPREDRDYAINLLRRRGHPVTLYEAKLNDHHYLLDIIKLGST